MLGAGKGVRCVDCSRPTLRAAPRGCLSLQPAETVDVLAESGISRVVQLRAGAGALTVSCLECKSDYGLLADLAWIGAGGLFGSCSTVIGAGLLWPIRVGALNVDGSLQRLFCVTARGVRSVYQGSDTLK